MLDPINPLGPILRAFDDITTCAPTRHYKPIEVDRAMTMFQAAWRKTHGIPDQARTVPYRGEVG
jgi:hypothetical protein